MTEGQNEQNANALEWLEDTAYQFSRRHFDEFARRFELKNGIAQKGSVWMAERVMDLGLKPETAMLLNGFTPIDIICAGYQSGDLEFSGLLHVCKDTMTPQRLWAFMASKAATPDSVRPICNALDHAIELDLIEKAALAPALELLTGQQLIEQTTAQYIFERLLTPLAETFGWTSTSAEDVQPPTVYEGRGKSATPPPIEDLTPDVERRASD